MDVAPGKLESLGASAHTHRCHICNCVEQAAQESYDRHMTSNDALTVKAGSLAFSIDNSGTRAWFTSDDFSSAERGRFWTLSLSIDDDRDVAVHSEDQEAQVTIIPDGALLRYRQLRTVSGRVVNVELEITVLTIGDEFSFRATGTTPADLAVREIALPIIELAPHPQSRTETLYRAEGLGRKIDNPRSTLVRAHTEYMRDDSAGIWEQSAYPGEMGMPWHGLQAGENFLYLARHDPEFRGALFSAGVPSRDPDGELWLTVVSPTDRSSIDTGTIVVALLDGGWKAAAAHYRSWADTWYSGPPAGYGQLQGWQRIIMRHQFGGEQFSYDDLVPIFERGREHGLDGILLFGWWKAGFDRGYPSYEPDDALGGAAGLARAIKTITDRGGFISLYANGNIIDRTTDYFTAHAAEVSKKDTRGLDYIAGYDFAAESLTTRYFAAPSFVAACHGAPRWRAEMASVAAGQAALGTRSVFFDQAGFHLIAWPCFDESHEHGTSANVEAQYRAKTLQGIREAANGAAVGSEGMADHLIPYLDFHHGLGFAFQSEDEAFPALFRTVFPEPVMSNRFTHDERPGWEDQLNYAFVYNLAFDVAIHRGRRTIAAVPAYGDRITRLIALRRAHAGVFEAGSFELLGDNAVVSTRFVLNDEHVETHWNRTDQDITLDDGTVIRSHDVALVHGRTA
jgi:hypothetical protein